VLFVSVVLPVVLLVFVLLVLLFLRRMLWLLDLLVLLLEQLLLLCAGLLPTVSEPLLPTVFFLGAGNLCHPRAKSALRRVLGAGEAFAEERRRGFNDSSVSGG